MPYVREILFSEKSTKKAVHKSQYSEFLDFNPCELFFDQNLFILNNAFYDPILRFRENTEI